MKTSIHLFKFTRAMAIFAAVGFLGHAHPASGAVITPRSQSRSVEIALNVSGVPQSASDAAADYGVYNKTLNYAGGSLYDSYQVQAAQNSEIGASAISATGGIIDRLGNQLVQRGKAQSDFKVVFRIVQPVSYTLGGSLSWDQTTAAAAVLTPTVTLSGAAGVIYQATTRNNGLATNYATAGVLQPGEYVIEAHAAASVPYAGVGVNKSFSLLLALTPSGPPQPGAGQVYALNGTLMGLANGGTALVPVTLKAPDVVNIALARPAATVSNNEVLALVSDNLDHSIRVVVWDIRGATVLAELGQVVLSGGFTSSASFATMADLQFNRVGRILDTLNKVASGLTMTAQGTFDPAAPATVNAITASPAIGQINYTDEAGANQSILITRGSLFTARKLGTTP